MSCGAGRGRGWLNLTPNSEPPKPMGLPQPLPPAQSPPVKVEHQELINRVKELSVNDDGILLNRKVQHIQAFWHDCSGEKEVEDSFGDLYNTALTDSELATKVVTVAALRGSLQPIHDCKIRNEFIKRLQKDFENSNQLQTTNPVAFRNCLQMLGEFVAKATMATGEPYRILIKPLLTSFDLLLNSKSLPDFILFTNLLFLNGSILKSRVPEDLAKITIKIRNLISDSQLMKEARLWLLLALDLSNVRFGVLSSEIFKFYEEQLGTIPMINFQRPHDPLSIQTVHTSKILDSYQSNVNVLQISTSPTEPPNDVTTPQFGNSTDYQREKPGRPILGVGARFVNKNKEENGYKQKNTRGPKKTPPEFKNRKGWEHDDRFENDYN